MGKPGRSQGRSSPAREKQTRGTETSHYPEEEKATAIPLVAASERGPAQTRGACTPGVVGPRHGSTTPRDRKSTRLNSSHLVISYAVFCLKKKKQRSMEMS